MKTTLRIFAAIVMIAGFSSNLMAQVGTSSPTAAGAKIVQALTLTEASPLHFGTMAIPTGATNVSVSTTNVRTASVPGNITLLAQIPVNTTASYNVTGSAAATYAITLPGSTIISNGTPANNMTVNGFLARTASAGVDGLTGTLNITTGLDSFTVGATLGLANAQPAGVYAGTFSVTIAYN